MPDISVEKLGGDLSRRDQTEFPFAEFLPPDYPERTFIPATDPDFYTGQETTAAEEVLGGEHYAWPNILRWMNKRHEARSNTRGDVVFIDLCSAFPIHAELIRSRYFTYCGRLSKEIVQAHGDEMFKDELWQEMLASTEELSVDDAIAVDKIATKLRSPKTAFGALLRADLQNVFYKLRPGDMEYDEEGSDQLRLTAMLGYELTHSSVTYTTENAHETYEKRMAIHTLAHQQQGSLAEQIAEKEYLTSAASALRKSAGQLAIAALMRGEKLPAGFEHLTVEDIMATTPISPHVAQLCVEYLSQFFAVRIKGEDRRPQRFISVDIADRHVLLADAPLSFDQEHRQSALFARTCIQVERAEDHWQMDIFSEDFESIPDGSVTMFTIFDGFPFYFGQSSMPEQSHGERRLQWLTFAERVYRKLKPGGHLIIFPWDVKDMNNEEEQLLDDMVRLWLDYDKGPGEKAAVSTKKYMRRTLQDWMKPLELKLSDHSPILQVEDDDHIFEALLLEKPRRAHRHR